MPGLKEYIITIYYKNDYYKSYYYYVTAYTAEDALKYLDKKIGDPYGYKVREVQVYQDNPSKIKTEEGHVERSKF